MEVEKENKPVTAGVCYQDNYITIKELGRGSMGTVFLARDLKLQRQVAIKTLNFDETMDENNKEEAIYYFRREAIGLASLNHENIVNIFDFGEDHDIHYIVMELIDGQPLSKILKLHPLPPETVLSIAVQICSALSYVHRHSVIHRDIKPENILLLGKGLAKLTDFGLSKFNNNSADEKYNTEGSVIGTLSYMSPEQLQNSDDVDERADLYSLAVSIYEILTGSLPFNGENMGDLVMKILREPPVPPSKLVPNLPETVDTVILKALSKNRNNRQSSVAQFEKELRGITEYKSFLEIRDLQFAHGRKSISESFLTSQPKLKYKSDKSQKKVTDNDIDLSWLDNLDFLIKEGEEGQNEKSGFLDSFNHVVPMITNIEIKNLLRNLNEAANQNEILTFLNSFDGVKSIKDIIEGNIKSHVFALLAECSDKDLLPPQVSEIINNLNFVVKFPDYIKSLLLVFKKLENPVEIINFLNNIDNIKSFKEIIDKYYSIEQAEYLLNILYECYQQEIINIETVGNPSTRSIFSGDMLVSFSYITVPQLNLALDKKSQEEENKHIGEILVKLGFLNKENLLNVLKLQLWYKKFFT
jgi:serine/threonine protein kinase